MSTHTATDTDALLVFLEHVCRLSHHTIRAYRTGLEQYEHFLRRRRRTARTARLEDVIAYAASLHDRKPATAKLRLAAVKRLHSYLHAMGYVERDVAKLVPTPRRVRGHRPAPSVPTVARARSSVTTPRDRALFGLLYGCALRISEVRFALLEDLDLERRHITVVGKGAQLRTVELDEQTAQELERWLLERPRSRHCSYLFPSYKLGEDKPISETPIRKLLERAAGAAGVPARELTPHGLRRARGRALRLAGADPFLVQAIYGHASIGQTSQYVGGEDAPTLPDVVREQLEVLERGRRSQFPAA